MAWPLIETLDKRVSYWLAYDESLNPHKFRVIRCRYISETFYLTEYGTVSLRQENNYRTATIKPKGRKASTVIYGGDEEVTEQDLLSLLVYWTVKPLFLAVPVSEITQEQTQQEPLF
nr:MAG TPA: hypothetical protein [Caudoviricetes sp.]